MNGSLVMIGPLTLATFAAHIAGLLHAGVLPVASAPIERVLIAVGGGVVAGLLDGRSAATRAGAAAVFVVYATLLAWLTQAYVGLRGGHILLPELLGPSVVAFILCVPLRRVVERWVVR